MDTLRKYLPGGLKKQIRLGQRWMRDRWVERHTFAVASADDLPEHSSIRLEQEIKRSHLFENKVHNIKLSAARVASFQIRPDEVFSFWRAVGSPSPGRGYRKGRNIINGELREDYGGGLCQLSGLIFHLALVGGLEIVERHNHSIDIYTDATRYAPIGTDATVVYGYKDLRIKNNEKNTLRFRFEFMGDEQITGFLTSTGSIRAREIRTEIQPSPTGKMVLLYDASDELVARANYWSNG